MSKRGSRRKGRNKLFFFLLLSIEILLLVGGFTYIQMRPMVVDMVKVEAGERELKIDEFLLYKNREGSFVTDIKKLNYKQPGSYPIQIRIGKRIHTSSIEIVDTTPPVATLHDQMVLREEKVEAASFVTDLIDATEVTISFLQEPDTKVLGDQKVTIVLEDSGHNRVEQRATLTVLDIRSTVSIEAGSIMGIHEEDFLDNNQYKITFLTDLSTLDISKPTKHEILLSVNDKTVKGYIEVIDTTKPQATVINQTIWNDETPKAEYFVKDIQDASDVIVSYKATPDYTKLGDQEVTIVLTDNSGNSSEFMTTLTVKEDTQAPTILGAMDKTVYIGDSMSYKKGVWVEDNKEENLSFTVDSSDVNLKKEGSYPVTYSAKDTSGNKVTKVITVTVKKLIVSEAMLNELSDEILNKIVKPSMTKRDSAFVIYTWVKKHVSYTGSSDKSDWMAEAYRGIKNGVGDCFTYFSISQALLTRAGIDNMEVKRVGGRTKHFWNLVNCGDGWYHFDSTPNKDHRESFMLTDAEVAKLTKVRGNNYYTFDQELYPATPEE